MATSKNDTSNGTNSSQSLDSNLLESLLTTATNSPAALQSVPSSARASLLNLTRSLTAQLEDPMDTIIWLCWTEPTRRAALITCAQLNIFNLLNAPTPVSKLAEATSCSPALLRRLLRQLAATYVLTNPSPDVYGPTRLSIALQEPKHSSALRVFPLHGPVLDKLPAFFQAKGYQEPIDETDGPFQFAHGEGHAFAWLAKTPGMMDQFALHMMGYRDSRPTFLSEGLYPFQDRIIDGARDKIKGAGDHEEVLFVDVGGGTGPDVQQVLDMFGKEIKDKGRCVLQDQKPMIDIANQVRPNIETQVTDFFKDQPIKGIYTSISRSYFFD